MPRAIAAAAVCLGLAGALLADEDQDRKLQGWEIIDSETELGIGYLSDDAWRFGRHTGLVDEGFFPLVHLDWFLRRPWDASSPHYAGLQVDDGGLPGRSIRVRAGRQGGWSFALEHNRIPFYQSDTVQTPYRPRSAADWTLPDDWQAGSSTAAMPLLLPSLGSETQQSRRRSTGAGLAAHIDENWTISTRYREDRRNGTRAMGATLGATGGNARSVMLAAPVDYRTREVEVTASHESPDWQMELGYLVSIFDNQYRGLRWDGAFAGVGGWHPAASHPVGRGQLALEPDNRFHQIRAAGGWRLSGQTRLTAHVAFGQMTQDDDFLPYTVNPALEVHTALPRQSLDGRVDTTVIDLRALHRPTARLQLTARYRLDDRDNRTPADEYLQLRGDAEDQATDPASNRRRFNRPYDYREHRAGVDARWRFSSRSRLNATIERKQVDRSFAEREEVRENRVELGYNHKLTRRLQTGLRGQWSRRSGSTYDGTADLVEGFAPEYAETVAGGWVNVPGLRQFHLADRRRFRLSGAMQFQVSEAWNLGAELFRMRDDYHRSEIGLTDNDGRGGHLSLGWTPNDDWSVHAHLSRIRQSAEQAGHSVRGGPNRLPDLENPERRWFVTQHDRGENLGLGVRRQLMDGRLRLQADFNYSRTRSAVDLVTGSDLEAEPLPDNRTRARVFMVRGEYGLRDNLDLVLRYWSERFDSADWAFDDVPPDQLGNVILTGETSPAYRVHVVTGAINYRF